MCIGLAEECYCPEQGARVVKSEVKKRISHLVAGMWLDEEISAGGGFVVKPDPEKHDVFVLDLS